MASLDFPASPADGDEFTSGDTTWQYNGTKGYWTVTTGGVGGGLERRVPLITSSSFEDNTVDLPIYAIYVGNVSNRVNLTTESYSEFVWNQSFATLSEAFVFIQENEIATGLSTDVGNSIKGRFAIFLEDNGTTHTAGNCQLTGVTSVVSIDTQYNLRASGNRSGHTATATISGSLTFDACPNIIYGSHNVTITGSFTATNATVVKFDQPVTYPGGYDTTYNGDNFTGLTITNGSKVLSNQWIETDGNVLVERNSHLLIDSFNGLFIDPSGDLTVTENSSVTVSGEGIYLTSGDISVSFNSSIYANDTITIGGTAPFNGNFNIYSGSTIIAENDTLTGNYLAVSENSIAHGYTVVITGIINVDFNSSLFSEYNINFGTAINSRGGSRIIANDGSLKHTGGTTESGVTKIRLANGSRIQVENFGFQHEAATPTSTNKKIEIDGVQVYTIPDNAQYQKFHVEQNGSSVICFDQAETLPSREILDAVTFTDATVHQANASFTDNSQVTLGSSFDLKMYHGGSHSYIDEVGTGFLKVRSNGTGIGFYKTDGGTAEAATTETMATFVVDGSVTLFHDNVERIRTNVGGIKITGGVEETVYTNASVGSTFTLDPVNGTIQNLTLSASSTFSDSLASGEYITLHILDGTAFTITWPTMEWIGGTAPTLDTTNETIINVWKSGSVLYGALVGVSS